MPKRTVTYKSQKTIAVQDDDKNVALEWLSLNDAYDEKKADKTVKALRKAVTK